MAAPSIAIQPVTLGAYHQIETEIDRYWVGGRIPVMHTLFVHEYGDLSVVAMAGDEIAGFLFGARSTTEPAGYVHLIGVRTDHRRRGIAGQLYRAFAPRAAAAGAEHLKAVVRPDNQPSIDFHTQLGMTAELVDDYVGPGQHRLVFRGPVDTLR
jgi:ribosomal protein S18 acetylase RimI-like enzyme